MKISLVFFKGNAPVTVHTQFKSTFKINDTYIVGLLIRKLPLSCWLVHSRPRLQFLKGEFTKEICHYLFTLRFKTESFRPVLVCFEVNQQFTKKIIKMVCS